MHITFKWNTVSDWLESSDCNAESKGCSLPLRSSLRADLGQVFHSQSLLSTMYLETPHVCCGGLIIVASTYTIGVSKLHCDQSYHMQHYFRQCSNPRALSHLHVMYANGKQQHCLEMEHKFILTFSSVIINQTK